MSDSEAKAHRKRKRSKCTLKFERQLAKDGYALIAGTDEVGRGALAGPVVAAAVILQIGNVPRGLNDSKQLTRARREELEEQIMKRAVAFAIARVEHDQIDSINILQASLLAMAQAAKALQPQPDYVLIDGRNEVPQLACPQMTIVKGDSLSASVAAASILAKVARDRLMREYDEQYPGYGFASHVGYNTREHQEAIARLGPSAIHRLTFQGVKFYQASLDLRD
ncbi:MAG TPA: ribonuclease HII [Blastocatellia bacterium]|nr:ribonuclease HII [Blastocatellia bacterium]